MYLDDWTIQTVPGLEEQCVGPEGIAGQRFLPVVPVLVLGQSGRVRCPARNGIAPEYST